MNLWREIPSGMFFCCEIVGVVSTILSGIILQCERNIKFEIVCWLNYFNMAWKVKIIAQNLVETVFPAQSVMFELPSWIVGSGSLVYKCTMYIYFDWIEPFPDLNILIIMISNTKRLIRVCVLLCSSFVLVSSFLLFCCVWSLKACSQNVALGAWCLCNVNFKGCCWEEKKEKKTTSKTVWCWCYQVNIFYC